MDILLGVAVGFVFVILREERKLLKDLRKLASLYPPFPADEDGKKLGTSSVYIDRGWDDSTPGRD